MHPTLSFAPLLVFAMAHAAQAGVSPASAAAGRDDDGCHALMTERECAAHLSRLALLRAGPERAQYLAQHQRTRREREMLCTRAHLSRPIVYYPARQAALRF